MFEFVQKFREAAVTIKIGTLECEIWTAAARPPAIRAQDRALTLTVGVLKSVLGKVGDAETMIETNYSQGRIWWGENLVAQRSFQNPEVVDYRLPALQKLDATITAASLAEVRAALEREQEEKRQRM